MMTPYVHNVQYYETDKMGVVHHSNYIRWMEEGRVDFLNQVGWGYDKLEAMGLSSPVIGVSCKYLLPTTFADVISIGVRVLQYTGARLVIGYEMRHQDSGKLVFTGQTEHCFFNAQGRPTTPRRGFPPFDALLQQMAAQ